MTHADWEYSDITPEINVLAEKMSENSKIDIDLYSKYDVKRGLRDIDGKGVLTGLTDISTIKQNKLVDGRALLSRIQCQRYRQRHYEGQPLWL